MKELAPPASRSEPVPLDFPHWKRNLAIVTAGFFGVNFTWSLVGPFIALYMRADLGLHDPSRLALWTGLSGGAVGVGMALASPVWGTLADRRGRKVMVVRAMTWGALMTMLLGATRTPLELVGIRLLAGVGGGSQGAATALVASETPRRRVGTALGVLASFRSLGQATGPLAGSIGASLFGFRAMFVASGALLLATTVPVAAFLRETARPPATKAIASGLRGLSGDARRALSAVIASQLLIQFTYSTLQQLSAIKVLSILPYGSAYLPVGLTFAAFTVSTAVAAVSVGRVSQLGYRRVVVGAQLLTAVGVATMAAAPALAALYAGAAISGAGLGLAQPSLASMVGLEAPDRVRATVFGLSQSAMAVGMGLGPVATGTLSAGLGIGKGMSVAALTALLAALVIALFGREPAP